MFSEAQARFRKKKSWKQNIMYNTCLIEHAKKSGQDLFLMFVDLRKAFDTVDRRIIYRILYAPGCPVEWICWIKNLAEDIVTHVAAGKQFTRKVPFLSGLAQGGPLSPYPFNIVKTIELLEVLFKLIPQWSKYTSLQLAPKKCKISIVSNKPSMQKLDQITLGETSIKVAARNECIQYLGVGFSAEDLPDTPFTYALIKWNLESFSPAPFCKGSHDRCRNHSYPASCNGYCTTA